MTIWSKEIKELASLYESLERQHPELVKELDQLVKTEDANVVMLYSRRCLEVISTDLCENELGRPRKTEPLKGVIDRLNKEEKVPSNIIASMLSLNSLATFGTHPKEYDLEQVKPVLNNLITIIKWYKKQKTADGKLIIEGAKSTSQRKAAIPLDTRKPKKKLIQTFSRLAIVALIIIVVLVVYNIFGGSEQSENIVGLEKSIAILPFNNLSEEKGNEHFVDGLVEDLLNRISPIEGLKVISRTSSEMYRERGVKSVPEIANELGVSFIVEGSVQRYGDKARITIQLIDAINDDHIWSEDYDREIVDIFETQSEIALQVATELKMILTSNQKTHIKENKTTNVKAFESYQMGRYYWNKRTGDGYTTSIEYFNKAINEDPEYGLAYAGLADTYNLMALQNWMDAREGRDKAIELALKALELDENLAEAYTVVASIYTYLDYDWENAEGSYQRAIEINPNYATAHQYYAEHLSITGKHEEARKHIDKAIELSPLSFVIRYVSAKLYYHRGLFAESLEEIERCNELHENHPWLYWRYYNIYWQLGEDEKLFELLWKLYTEPPIVHDLDLVKKIYSESGIQGVIDYDLEMLLKFSEDVIGYEYLLAREYGLLGEDEKALEWLEKYFEKEEFPSPETGFHFHFLNLHNNPRYIALMKTMGLEVQ